METGGKKVREVISRGRQGVRAKDNIGKGE